MSTVQQTFGIVLVLISILSLSYFLLVPVNPGSIPATTTVPVQSSVQKHYEFQDSLKAAYEKGDAGIEADVLFQNSHILPPRANIDLSFEQLCIQKPELCTDPSKVLFSSYKVVPEHKLAACLVQKSGSTATSGALCYLSNETQFTEQGRDMMKEWGDITMCKDHYVGSYDTLTEKYNLTEDWKVLFIKRDPIDRFLSGFLDLCVQKTHLTCLGCKHNMTCFLENLLDRALQYNSNHSTLVPEEYHIFPQIWQCEIPSHLKDFTTIEYSNDPTRTLLPGLTRFLASQQVAQESIDEVAKAFTSHRTAHSTVNSRYRQILERRLRSSPYLLELLVRLLYNDFVMLGFPFPLL